MKVGLEQSAAEDSHCITEIADGIAWHRLQVLVGILAAHHSVFPTYLDILPPISSGYHDLETTEAVV